jgi:hypothetical protein
MGWRTLKNERGDNATGMTHKSLVEFRKIVGGGMRAAGSHNYQPMSRAVLNGTMQAAEIKSVALPSRLAQFPQLIPVRFSHVCLPFRWPHRRLPMVSLHRLIQ